MRSGYWFPVIAALVLAALALPARPALAQQLISGMTGSACAARGGQITTWTNTAGRGPDVGDCYIPPRTGSVAAPSGGGAGAALGAGFMLLDALQNLLDSAPEHGGRAPAAALHSDWDDYLNSPEYQREKREWKEKYEREQQAREAALNDKTDEVSDFIRSGPAKPKPAADPCAGYPAGPAGVAQCYRAAAAELEQQAANCGGGCRAAMLRAAASARCVAALAPENAALSATVTRCGQNPAAGLQRVAAKTDEPKAPTDGTPAKRQTAGASQAQPAAPAQSAADWQKKCQQLEQAKNDSAISCWGGLSSSAAADPKLRAYAQQRAAQLERTMAFQPTAACPYGDAQSGIGGTQCVSNTISQGRCSEIGGIWYPSVNGSTAKCLYDRRTTAANSAAGPGTRQGGRRGHDLPASADRRSDPGNCGADCDSVQTRLVPGECSDIGGFDREGACWVMGVTTSDCEDMLRGKVAERDGYKYCVVENVVIAALPASGGKLAPQERRHMLDDLRERLRRDAAQERAAAEEAAVEQRLEREWYADAVVRYKAWIAAGKTWFAEDAKARLACPGSWTYDGMTPGKCDPAGPKRIWEVQFGQAPPSQKTADANSPTTADQPAPIPPCDPTAPGWHVEDGSSGEAMVVADPARRCQPLYNVTAPKPGERF
jgi:hypothetical protein